MSRVPDWPRPWPHPAAAHRRAGPAVLARARVPARPRGRHGRAAKEDVYALWHHRGGRPVAAPNTAPVHRYACVVGEGDRGGRLLLLDAHTDQETKPWEPRAFLAPCPGTFAITGSAIDFDNLVFAFLEEIEPIMSLNVRRVRASPRVTTLTLGCTHVCFCSCTRRLWTTRQGWWSATCGCCRTRRRHRPCRIFRFVQEGRPAAAAARSSEILPDPNHAYVAGGGHSCSALRATQSTLPVRCCRKWASFWRYEPC